MTGRRTPPTENPSPAPSEAPPLPPVKRTGALSVRLFEAHGTRSIPWLTFCHVVTKLAESIPSEHPAHVTIKDGLLMVTWEETS